MSNCVCYYRLGHQCYGASNMGEKAAELATLLNYDYREIDLEKYPEATQKEKLFFPGTIVIDDFKTVFPGTAEELLAAYRQNGPIEGKHSYRTCPDGIPDKILKLNNHLAAGAKICMGKQKNKLNEKKKWLEKHQRYTYGTSGFIAYKGNNPVAAVEFIQEKQSVYSLPAKRTDVLFITCIYNQPQLTDDYRAPLIGKTSEFAQKHGFKAISVIAGKETPYPNGPKAFFQQHGFVEKMYLDRVLLRHHYEEIFFYQLTI